MRLNTVTIDSTIAKAKLEADDGRLWRAREILTSSIPNYGYSKLLMRQLAEISIAMGDDIDAGKYLLLSTDHPDATECTLIATFLSRASGSNYQMLLSRFPKAARLVQREEYPEYLRSLLCDLGAPATLDTLQELPPEPDSRFSWVIPVSCTVVVLTALTCCIVGAYTILAWLGRLSSQN
ncbi:MAG: hypothetical protein Aurels2KO_41820 [Aureliella sp.]